MTFFFHPATRMATTISFATDCSGIDSPRVALSRALSLCGHHVQIAYRFASEINDHARSLIQSSPHGKPAKLFRDATERSEDDLPTVDVYCAGFPCVAFSGLGKGSVYDMFSSSR